MTSLLLISIGPVQDFIASARRGRDLWFGSWFLSEISKAAARALVDAESLGGRNGLDALIFPAPPSRDLLEVDSDFNCVNKLLARVETDPTALMDTVQECMHTRLNDIWQRARKKIPATAGTLVDEVAQKQLNDLLELSWVALPLSPETEDPSAYVRTRTRLEALLSARKSLRDFGPVTWGGPVPKSALDGQRESVIHEDSYKPRPGETPEQRAWRLYRGFGVSSGERLCAIGLLKRLGRPGNWKDDDTEEHRTPSVSHIAATPLLTRMEAQPTGSALIRDYVFGTLKRLGEDGGRPAKELRGDLLYPAGEMTGSFPYQGRILYESRLPELLGTRDAGAQAAQALKRLLKKLADGREPSPYYALVLADGDRMGVAVDQQTTHQAHQRLSRALSRFADSIRPDIDQVLKGRLIYSGGDDVLAFLPLHTLLTGIEILASTFFQAMKVFGNQDGSPTLSLGVVIAHHMEPLSDVLERVRQAEKLAKDLPGKNALAITLSKRGGADVTICDHTSLLLNRLRLFTGWHCGEFFPDGAAFELRDAAIRHSEPSPGFRVETSNPARTGAEIENQRLTRKALAYDALRILSRKQAARGSRKLDDSVRTALEALLLAPMDLPDADRRRVQTLLEPWTNPNALRGEAPLTVRGLAHELIVARIFAEAVDQSGQYPDGSPVTPSQRNSHPLQEVQA